MRIPSRWVEPRTSVVFVIVLALCWLALTLGAPSAMAWLNPDPIELPTVEGPLEALENVILLACLVLWAVIARRSAPDRLRVGLSLAMMLQLVVLLGEEVDWGANFGWRWARVRNLRMYFREIGVLPPWADAIGMTLFLLPFLLLPLVPLGRVQRSLERAAPIRARRLDAVAVLALPPALGIISLLCGPQPSVELIQFGAYGVVLLITLRVLRDSRPVASKAPPDARA